MSRGAFNLTYDARFYWNGKLRNELYDVLNLLKYLKGTLSHRKFLQCLLLFHIKPEEYAELLDLYKQKRIHKVPSSVTHCPEKHENWATDELLSISIWVNRYRTDWRHVVELLDLARLLKAEAHHLLLAGNTNGTYITMSKKDWQVLINYKFTTFAPCGGYWINRVLEEHVPHSH